MAIKERVYLFIEYKGITVKKFEELCDLSNGYISSMRKGFGSGKLNNVLTIFPELNREWLLYGEGEMLNPKVIKNNQSGDNINGSDANIIPLLPVSAQGGSLNDFVASVRDCDCEKVVSPVRDADFAIPVTGESMAPEYPSGSQVHVKRINESAFIEWGRVYVLDTCNGTVIKRIVPSNVEGCIRCISINPDPMYAPFDVSLKDVYGIYRVMICLSIK